MTIPGNDNKGIRQWVVRSLSRLPKPFHGYRIVNRKTKQITPPSFTRYKGTGENNGIGIHTSLGRSYSVVPFLGGLWVTQTTGVFFKDSPLFLLQEYKGLLLAAQFKVEIRPAGKPGVQPSWLPQAAARGPPSVQRVPQGPLQRSFDLTSSVQ